jgi:ribosome-associated toxin RatA of RatAB toxin-antitoxin module
VTTVNRSALVPFSAEQMYSLVDDIDRYPEFLPWCRSTTVLLRETDQVRATIEIAHKGLNKAFTTQNRMQHNKMIEMRLVEGPFKHLEGFWRFDSLGNEGCKVSLDMEFEFAGKLLSMTLGPLFNQIAGSLVDAFTQRAQQLYG